MKKTELKRLLILCWLSLFIVFASAEESVGPPSFNLDLPKEPSLQAFLDDYQIRVKNEVLAEYEETKAEGSILNPWSLDFTGRLTYRDRFWCLTINGYDYRGGAHGLPYLDVVYFDGASKNVIALSDLLVPDALEKLQALSLSGLAKQGFNIKDDWVVQGTEAKSENYKILSFSSEGLEITFPSYQVAPYAAGTPSVKVPWKQAKNLIVEKYR